MTVKMKLHTRYALVIVGLVVAVVTVLTAILLYQFRVFNKESVELNRQVFIEQAEVRAKEQVEILVLQLARNLRNPLYYLDMEAMEELLEVTMAQPEVVQAKIFDNTHQVVLSGADHEDTFGDISSLSTATDERLRAGQIVSEILGTDLQAISPIYLGEDYLGSVEIVYSLESIRQRIAEVGDVLRNKQKEGFSALLKSVAVVSLILLTAGIAVSSLIARKLQEPIEQLVRFAQQVGSGILDKQVDVQRQDELGDLAASLNHMASRLDHRTREIQFLAYHDALTKLPNRDYLKNSLSAAIARAKRNESSLALLFIDIDNFKTINDVYGHEAGDFILVAIARRLRECLRDCDVISRGADNLARESLLGRLAGDEFIVLLEGGKDEVDAAAISQRILDRVSSAYQWKNTSISLGISIGIAVYPDNGKDTETLLRNADAAMYHVKGLGKNNFHFFSPELDRIAHQQLELVDQLDRAMKENQLELWYQGIFDSGTRELVGAEALLRWQHPTRGLLLPEVFMPMSEKSIHSFALGEWVIRKACAQLQDWQVAAPHFFISINISPIQLQRKGWLMSKLENAVASPDLASHIKLEITETFFLKAEGSAKEELQEIKAKGFQVWLDDFGTGYSSLNHLRHFPVDGVKIDRSYIAGLEEQWESKALTEAIIRVAQAFNIGVIAEGVESEAQESILSALDCRLVQGFRYSRPLPVHEFQNLVRIAGAEDSGVWI